MPTFSRRKRLPDAGCTHPIDFLNWEDKCSRPSERRICVSTWSPNIANNCCRLRESPLRTDEQKPSASITRLMDLQFLGGAREIGRSAVLMDSLLLDFGMLTDNPPQFPVETPNPDAAVVSHRYLDHVGTIPSLLSGDARPPIHWTPPTYELALTLVRDTLKLHGGSSTVRSPKPMSSASHRCRKRTGIKKPLRRLATT